jgi:hypothetical protein
MKLAYRIRRQLSYCKIIQKITSKIRPTEHSYARQISMTTVCCLNITIICRRFKFLSGLCIYCRPRTEAHIQLGRCCQWKWLVAEGYRRRHGTRPPTYANGRSLQNLHGLEMIQLFNSICFPNSRLLSRANMGQIHPIHMI